MTGFLNVGSRSIEAFFCGQLPELLKCRLFSCGEMPKVTFQPGLSTGRFSWWRLMLIIRCSIHGHDFPTSIGGHGLVVVRVRVFELKWNDALDYSLRRAEGVGTETSLSNSDSRLAGVPMASPTLVPRFGGQSYRKLITVYPSLRV